MIGIGVMEIILILAAIVLLISWLWMLIDCLKRPDDMFKFGGNNAKLIWVLVIIFTGLIGALIYYFLIKKADKQNDRLIVIALLALIVIVIILIAGFAVSTISIEPHTSSKLIESTPYETAVSSLINQTPSSYAGAPAISAIQPDFGTIGTKAVITGAGLTARDNNVAFRLESEDSNETFKVGYINNLVSRDGSTIEFVIPELLGACAFPLPVTTPAMVCPAIGIPFKPGTQTYRVFIVNQNGMSNSVNFTVSR